MQPAEQYIADVLAGRLVAGKQVRRAVERHVRELAKSEPRTANRAFYFDRDEAQFAIDCFSFFRHSKGKWAGARFQLSPWQAFIIWCVFGWKRRADRTRRFRRVYIEVARKNGKSTFLAGILLILFALDGEEGAEVYSAATKKDQARIVFNEAKRMVKKSPELRAFIQAHRNNLDIPSTESKFEPLSADANSMDGLNIHGAGVDELHAHKTREVWDVLDTATGSREQPLIAIITTAGFNQEGVCFELRGYCLEVLDPELPTEDDDWFIFIASIDDDDDWQDEACWSKANPNLGVSCFLDDLRAKARRARRNSAALNNFLCKHLDRWTQQLQRWLLIEDWDACQRDIDLATLEGRDAYGGLDLSEKCDLNAFALIFPPAAPNEPAIVLLRFWAPEAVIEKRGAEGDWKYDAWVKAGLLEATPGEVSDYDIIKQDIIELGQTYNIRQISFDPWNALHLSTQLTAAGFEMVEVPQTHRYMNETSKDFEAQILGGKLAHTGDQLLRWMVDNVAIVIDKEARIRPVKPKDRRKKIDGVVAALLANRSRLAAPPDTYSPSEVLLV